MNGIMNYFRFLYLLLSLLVLSGCAEDDTPYDIEAFPDGTQYHFNVFGDSRDGNSVYSSLISTALTAGLPAFSVHVGDMISGPSKGGQLPIFFALSSPLAERSLFFPVIGNHDVNDQESLDRLRATFPQIPPSGYYSKKVKNIFCVFMNTEETDTPTGTLSDGQMLWLEDQLNSETAFTSKYIAVFTHRPPFPRNRYKHDPLANNSELHRIFIDYGVDMVFSGHEHNYSHNVKDDIHYVITGGAGAPLHDNSEGNAGFFHFVQISALEDSLIVKVFDFIGDKRDEFKVFL